MLTHIPPSKYWFAPRAVTISLNALDDHDTIQVSVAGNAVVMVHMEGIDGLDYDAGHNYRRWRLVGSPTYFPTHTAKYVYIAIPRPATATVPDASASGSSASGSTASGPAMIVFPSEEVDLYGKNAQGEQLYPDRYYYLFTNAIITSSGEDGNTRRDWAEGHDELITGTLHTDYGNDHTTDSDWYEYITDTSVVKFLKDLTMAAGTVFRNLYARTLQIVSGGSITFENGNGEINKVAEFGNLTDNSAKDIVTPAYLSDREAKIEEKYLRKDQDDETEYDITAKNLKAKESVEGKNITAKKDDEGNGGNVRAEGNLFVDGNSTFVGDVETNNISNRGKITTKDLEVTGEAHFFSLVIDEVKSVGGRMILSPASMVVDYVSYDAPELINGCVRLYQRSTNGSEEIQGQFRAGDFMICQTFNIKGRTSDETKPLLVDSEGFYILDAEGYYLQEGSSVTSNTFYRSYVVNVGTGTYLDDNGEEVSATYIDILLDPSEYCDAEYNYGTVEPSIGDNIVSLGHATDKTRQSAIILSAYTDGYLDTAIIAPSFAQYDGIDSIGYIDEHRRNYIAKNGSKFVGDFSITPDLMKEISNAIHEPKIIDGYWHTWSAQEEKYVSTGIKAEGQSARFRTLTDNGCSATFGVVDNISFINVVVSVSLYDINGKEQTELPVSTTTVKLIDDTGQPLKIGDIRNNTYGKFLRGDLTDSEFAKVAAAIIIVKVNKGDTEEGGEAEEEPMPLALDDETSEDDTSVDDSVVVEGNLDDDEEDDNYETYTITVPVTFANGVTFDINQKTNELNAWARGEDGDFSHFGMSPKDIVLHVGNAGINLIEGTITLSAENTIIDGDLNLKGVIVESTKNNNGETATIIVDMDNTKSITVNNPLQTIVVLPMYVEHKYNLSPEGENPTYWGTPAYKQAGTHLTIYTTPVDDLQGWSSLDASKWVREGRMGDLLTYSTLVCADPRMLCMDRDYYNNYRVVRPMRDWYGGNNKLEDFADGRFSVHGAIGRFILLPPGQMLHLISSIEQYKDEYGQSKDVLVWNVINAADFAPAPFTLTNYNTDNGDEHIFSNGTPNMGMDDTGTPNYWRDMFFAVNHYKVASGVEFGALPNEPIPNMILNIKLAGIGDTGGDQLPRFTHG